MKKLVLSILCFTLLASTMLFISSCGNKHEHFFVQEVVDDSYLASAATCTKKATYYLSCECGEKGTSTFEYGSPLGHSLGEWTTIKLATETEPGIKKRFCTRAGCSYSESENIPILHPHKFTEQIANDKYLASAATCTEKAKYYYSCKCGQQGTTTFEYGSPLGHKFTNYVSDKNATSTEDGTKTAKCDRCKETDTIVDENSALGFSITWKSHDGKILKTTKCKYNAFPSYGSETPTRESDSQYFYAFNGWVPAIVAATEDATYTATYAKTLCSSYTISYNANGGSNAPSSQKKSKGYSTILSSATPINGSHIFIGWACANDGKTYSAGSSFNIDANVTLYAVWGHTCNACNGEGTIKTSKNCATCSGSGKVTKSTNVWSSCLYCGGRGSTTVSILGACSSCKGLGGDVLCSCSCGNKWWQNQTGNRKCSKCGKIVPGTRIKECSKCNGSGTEKKTSTQTCTACNGAGGKYVSSSSTVTCSSCNGTGKITESSKCPTCQGNKNLIDDNNSYTVSLKDENNNFRTESVTLNTPYKLSVPQKNGYTFVGWFDSMINGIQYTDGFGVCLSVWNKSNNKVLYAHWETNHYKITYDCDDSVDLTDMPTEYTVEDSLIQLNAQHRDYYDFKWLLNGQTIATIDTAMAKDLFINGIWLPIEYSIVYKFNGGTTTNKTAYNIESETFKLNNPTRLGYTFIGWTGSNGEIPQTEIVIEKGSHGNLSYTANWEVITYSIIINLNGAEDIYGYPTSYTVEDEINLPAPVRPGYTLSGWAENNKIEKGSIGDKEYNCIWTAETYRVSLDGIATTAEKTFTVSFNLNGAPGTAPSAQTVNNTRGLIYPSIPTRNGYIFGGWYTTSSCSGNPYNFVAEVTSDVTLYAKWVAYSGAGVIPLNGTTVTANVPCGAYNYYAFYSLVDTSVYYNTTRYDQGYRVELCNSSKQVINGLSNKVRGTVSISAYTLYYIRYTTSNYARTIDVNLQATTLKPTAGGKTVGSTTIGITDVVFGSSFTLSTDISRTGYTFAGWYDGIGGTGTQYTDAEGNSVRVWDKAENTTLYPKWNVNQYTISFVSNGGSTVNSITQDYGSAVTAPTKPTWSEKSFVGWFTDSNLTNEYHFTTMSAENVTLYAKWIEYSVSISCDDTTEISINDTVTSPDTYNATAIDTDGNPVNITVSVIGGTFAAGKTVTVRLVANGLYEAYATKTISNIKVYGIPTLSYDTEKDYFNLSDTLNAALWGASATDTFGTVLSVSVSVKESNYSAGDLVTIVIFATDITGNETKVEIANVKVYGAPVITRDTTKNDMKATDTVSNELFGVSAVDSFGVPLTVTTVKQSGTISGGNTITVKSSATDSKGNTNYITYTVKVYGLPTIGGATKTSFKVDDTISLDTLGIIAKDSFDNRLSNVTLTLTEGDVATGQTLTYLVTATDHLGNVQTRTISGIRIYGSPTILFDTAKGSMKVTDTVNANLFSAVAKDSHNGELVVTVTVESGTIAGGNVVKFRLSTVDALGNEYSIVTQDIKVYSSDCITLNYNSVASTRIKKASHGEEFNASAVDGFGESCAISIEAAEGYTLAGGNTINLYIVATDALGNTTKSALIKGIKIYDTPTLTFLRNELYIFESESPYELFLLTDSFGDEVLYNVETISGTLEARGTVVYKITATDRVGNSIEETYELYVVSIDESVLKLYREEELIDTQRVFKGDQYTLPCFDGYNVTWYLNGNAVTNENGTGLSPWVYNTGIYSLKCSLSVIKYSITYELNGGTNNENNPTKYTIESDTITLFDPIRDYYNFIGWGEGNMLPAGSFGNKVFTAKWQAIEYTITYELGGGTNNVNNPTKYTIESDTITLADPTRDYYNFIGWKEGNVLPGSSFGNKVFTAKWQAIEYTITYELSGGKNNDANPTIYTVEDEVVLKAPTKLGYEFLAWSDNGKIEKGSTGDKTFTASWKVITYTITYDLVGGKNDNTNPTIYTVEDEVVLKAPTKLGYEFIGWSDNGKIEKGSTGDKTFTANWKVIEYSITYELDGGTNNKNNPAKYTIESDDITLFDPNKLGYEFIGWSDNDKIEKGSTGNKTFTASWKVITYTITYDLVGGKNNDENPTTYTVEDEVVLQVPTKLGYEFIGWSDNGKIEKGSTGDKTFTAKWKVIEYSITYELDGGTNNENNPAKYTVESDTITLAPPTKRGFTFDGWSDGGVITKGSTGNKTFTAYYTALKFSFSVEKSISYATIDASNNGIYESGTSLFAEIKGLYKGYQFDGWYDDDTLISKDYKYTFSVIDNDINLTARISVLPEMLVFKFKADAKTCTINGLNDTTISSLTIPGCVTSIDSYAFDGYKNLTSITIFEGVVSIGSYAFSNCTEITSITIPDSVTSIGSAAFNYCYALTSITIPNGVTSIKDWTFNNCSSLASITIPDGVTSIGMKAFCGCKGLTSITIPDSVTYIGSYAFYGCTGLTSITIPDNVTSIGWGAFTSCSSLTSITIPDGVTSIGESAFSLCSSLASITIPNGVTAIESFTFNNCSSLTSITIPEGVTSIGNSAFNGCNSLTSITIPDGVTSIGNSAFNGCNSLTSITIPNGITAIKSQTFYNCSSLTNITIPDSVTSIGARAFNGCSNLTSITIPNGVTAIEDWTFYNCNNLTSITLPESVISIGSHAFTSCSSLTSITIPDGVTSIGESAFSLCSNLTNIIIPNIMTSIGESAFAYCRKLEKVYYKGTESEWEKITISENSNLDNTTRYYYSEQKPAESGYYWHYNDNGEVEEW